MIAPPSVLLASRLPWFLRGAAPAAPWRTEGGTVMFQQFYFFLVSNAVRGVAFSAEGFLYVYSFLNIFTIQYHSSLFQYHTSSTSTSPWAGECFARVYFKEKINYDRYDNRYLPWAGEYFG